MTIDLIHVGANTGQEAAFYAQNGRRVLWIEPVPEVFNELTRNISAYPNQFAANRLITDRDGALIPFHVSNFGGMSSSILDFKMHREVWPAVTFERDLTLTSITLPSLLTELGAELAGHPVLVLDTQGSELLVLKGAAAILNRFVMIKTEVADFESYAGCCQVKDIEAFLAPHDYREFSRTPFAKHTGGGQYFDMLYSRQG